MDIAVVRFICNCGASYPAKHIPPSCTGCGQDLTQPILTGLVLEASDINPTFAEGGVVKGEAFFITKYVCKGCSADREENDVNVPCNWCGGTDFQAITGKSFAAVTDAHFKGKAVVEGKVDVEITPHGKVVLPVMAEDSWAGAVLRMLPMEERLARAERGLRNDAAIHLDTARRLCDPDQPPPLEALHAYSTGKFLGEMRKEAYRERCRVAAIRGRGKR